ncbi:MAG: glycosyltransferase family 2 protein [Pseudorhodobacter sp.]
MNYSEISDFLSRSGSLLATGPVAVVMAEDGVELDSTIRHNLRAGFRVLILLTPDEIALSPELADQVHRVRHDIHAENALVTAVNRLIDAASGSWIYYCFNAEYLFYPFCETRNIREMLAFQVEERREAILSYVIDLYAADLTQHPNAVCLQGAQLDRSGYYALGRRDPANHNHPRERQLDFFGGLRWRFEEHIPPARRKIDRIALFRARTGLKLRADFTFSDEEYNTYACPWHHNITTAIASFRTAKALKTNPGSTFDIQTFQWRNSTEFQWHSQQLMDLGLMEPGQWF